MQPTAVTFKAIIIAIIVAAGVAVVTMIMVRAIVLIMAMDVAAIFSLAAAIAQQISVAPITSLGKGDCAAHGEQGCHPNRENIFHFFYVAPRSVPHKHFVRLG